MNARSTRYCILFLSVWLCPSCLNVICTVLDSCFSSGSIQAFLVDTIATRVCVCACIVLASLYDIVGSIGTCLHSIFRFHIKTTRLKQYMLCIVMYILCLICKCDLFFLFSSIQVFSIRLKK